MHGNKGRRQSGEHKRKIGLANTGKPFTDEMKEKQRKAHLGKKASPETKLRMSIMRKGKKLPPLSKEAKHKMSLAKLGERHWNWRGGLSNQYYTEYWTDILRESIRQRDNYICRECGIHQEELDFGKHKKLDIHHIDYDKKNCDPKNLISLCKICHGKTNINREYWLKYFTQNTMTD
jgi:hypothetical protein